MSSWRPSGGPRTAASCRRPADGRAGTAAILIRSSVGRDASAGDAPRNHYGMPRRAAPKPPGQSSSVDQMSSSPGMGRLASSSARGDERRADGGRPALIPTDRARAVDRPVPGSPSLSHRSVPLAYCPDVPHSACQSWANSAAAQSGPISGADRPACGVRTRRHDDQLLIVTGGWPATTRRRAATIPGGCSPRSGSFAVSARCSACAW